MIMATLMKPLLYLPFLAILVALEKIEQKALLEGAADYLQEHGQKRDCVPLYKKESQEILYRKVDLLIHTGDHSWAGT